MLLRSGQQLQRNNVNPIPQINREMAVHGINPKKFNGTLDENIDEWIAMYDHVTDANHWTDAEKVGRLGCFLEGTACSWYLAQLNLPVPLVTWANWCDALR